MRTAAVELARRAPDALCCALHPDTVATPLSIPFTETGLKVYMPEQAGAYILEVVERLTVEANGSFFDWRGQSVFW